MSYKSPLNIYVVWHPDFKDGKHFADLIYKTFNRDTEFALKRNLNIPVYYRSQPDEQTKVPIPINYKDADKNAVVVLVDEELYLSTGWDKYVKNEIIDKIAKNENNRLYPIALSKNAYSLEAEGLSRLQFIRADSTKNDDKEKEITQRWRLIRSRLLHDFARLMYKIDSVGDTIESEHQNTEQGYNAKPKPPVKLFISHAKADGLELAKKLRNYINNETQLDTFFDANDIADSHRFDHQILDQFNDQTAVIAVLSDEYATREWCRLEISMAKRKKCPLVVVQQIEKGEIRSFPYLGNVPSIRWNDSNLQDIIDLTLIQVLNARFAQKYLDKHLQLYGLKTKYQCMIFSSPPELFNYIDILEEDKKDKKVGLVIYPDPPLGNEELKILNEIIPDVKFTTPLHSYQFL